jgi:membrane-anchored protein YejM (alkaline phosphatase superfamily)
MTDSQKRSACQQKRNAEKKDTQTGKGQKPVMTSYKTKKESIDSLVDKILTEIRNSF